MQVREIQGLGRTQQLYQTLPFTFLWHPSFPSLGYVISATVFFLMVVIIFLTTFNSWWLSHWLEQGSGVSVMVGMKCVFMGWNGVGQLPIPWTP